MLKTLPITECGPKSQMFTGPEAIPEDYGGSAEGREPERWKDNLVNGSVWELRRLVVSSHGEEVIYCGDREGAAHALVGFKRLVERAENLAAEADSVPSYLIPEEDLREIPLSESLGLLTDALKGVAYSRLNVKRYGELIASPPADESLLAAHISAYSNCMLERVVQLNWDIIEVVETFYRMTGLVRAYTAPPNISFERLRPHVQNPFLFAHNEHSVSFERPRDWRVVFDNRLRTPRRNLVYFPNPHFNDFNNVFGSTELPRTLAMGLTRNMLEGSDVDPSVSKDNKGMHRSTYMPWVVYMYPQPQAALGHLRSLIDEGWTVTQALKLFASHDVYDIPVAISNSSRVDKEDIDAIKFRLLAYNGLLLDTTPYSDRDVWDRLDRARFLRPPLLGLGKGGREAVKMFRRFANIMANMRYSLLAPSLNTPNLAELIDNIDRTN